MLNKDNLKNPFIKVTWEDTPENFTQEKIKRLKSYFKKKETHFIHLLIQN